MRVANNNSSSSCELTSFALDSFALERKTLLWRRRIADILECARARALLIALPVHCSVYLSAGFKLSRGGARAQIIQLFCSLDLKLRRMKDDPSRRLPAASSEEFGVAVRVGSITGARQLSRLFAGWRRIISARIRPSPVARRSSSIVRRVQAQAAPDNKQISRAASERRSMMNEGCRRRPLAPIERESRRSAGSS